MRYLIVYLIKGNGKKFQENLMEDVSKKFNLESPRKRIMPHITLKAPFEFPEERIEEVETIIKNYLAGKKKEEISANDFYNFEKRVFFIQYNFVKEARVIYKKLLEELKKIKDIKFDRFDGKETFHATICYTDNPKRFDEINNYLKNSEKPQIKAYFDNVTLLKKEGKEWEIVREFTIGNDGNSKL